jgi:DnaK suppressor protein
VKSKAVASAAKAASPAKLATRSVAKAKGKTVAKVSARKPVAKTTSKTAPRGALKKTVARTPSTAAKSAAAKSATLKSVAGKAASKKVVSKKTAGKHPLPAKAKVSAAPAKPTAKTTRASAGSKSKNKTVAPVPKKSGAKGAGPTAAVKTRTAAPVHKIKAVDRSVAVPVALSVYSMPVRVISTPHPTPVKKNQRLAANWKAKPIEQWSDEEVIAMPDEEYMNSKQLAFFRLRLLTLKEDLLSNAGETTENLRGDTVVVPDPADRATIEEEHALELRTRDRERKLLKKIEQAITRIDTGDYGYCDETGEAIGVARLLARPTATLSLEAQQRRELKQKLFGD